MKESLGLIKPERHVSTLIFVNMDCISKWSGLKVTGDIS